MATLLGYRGVLLAADALPRVFPLMMTAAGTLSPARVLIMGVGVAGLSAIATAKRLGASVLAYDVRAAAKEQVAMMVQRLLPGSGKHGKDAADALAVAICHAHHCGTNQRLAMGRILAGKVA